MSNVKRHQQIMELLIQQGEVKVNELSEQLEVTGKTIRADLEALEAQGLLTRVHGGAVLKNMSDLGLLPVQAPNRQHLSEKAEIAEKAVRLIEPDDIIALDGGSTTLEMAKRLDHESLTVVTNDLFIIAELIRKPDIRLVVPGGYRNRNLLVSSEAVQLVRKLNIQKAFVSSTGIHTENGLTIYTSELYDLKRAWIETAKHSYGVVDHTKFGKSALLTFASLSDMTAVITDSGLNEEAKATYIAAGVPDIL
ncbi:DeoR/GlpR family DNA-binding transcription regulator [Paenibacillus thiaminolyticus]|uniref:DeoR/GlpR family DNA-binding transcription regulator n=1 Tax=Paenibacillus thiaminolyticus TaxID=49283 RepID=UPI00232D2BF4|nr:DeoR/GlpR family DNA-binding transcription regulator [Paenibacillus thiaminolyticus]WCF06446.1 DeoR/GlpR family DNA-binding transcription regulator [Paenibacillus thiaminolyticus]